MRNILKKISIPAKEFSIARFRCNGRTEIEYSLRGFLFGIISIRLTISEKEMKTIIDFYNNKKAQDANTETYYDF